MKLFGSSPERRDFNGVHNPFESPTVPLSSLALDSVFGAMNRSDSGEMVTIDSAFGLPTFWRCVDLLSTVVAQCPLRTYRNPGKIEVFPKLLNPSNTLTTYTQYELIKLIMVHLAVFGNAFVLKVRADGPDGAGTGVVADLKPINPQRVQITIENGQKVFNVTRVDGSGNLDNTAPPLELSINNIMHIPTLSYDGVQGMSVLNSFKRTLGTSQAGDRLAAKFYQHGSMLSGVIQVKAPIAKQEQADSIRQRWIQKSGGVDHAAEVAVLDSETTFMPLTIPPDQLQFLESRQWQCNEMARLFGIPPFLVGDTEKSTSWGTGIESINTAFVAYTIADYTNVIEQRITRELIPTSKQYCQFDMNKLLRGSMVERFQAYTFGINGGFVTRNEAREAENLEPLPGLDEPLVPMNMTTLSTDGTALGVPGPPPPPAPEPSDDQFSDPS